MSPNGPSSPLDFQPGGGVPNQLILVFVAQWISQLFLLAKKSIPEIASCNTSPMIYNEE
jgi:hypothetical protein